MSGITIFLAVFSVLGGGGGVDANMTHRCPSHPYRTICPLIFTILVIRSTVMTSSYVDTSDWFYLMFQVSIGEGSLGHFHGAAGLKQPL